jgi:hypothetical protein
LPPVEDMTRAGYESMIRLYIRPLLGDLSISRTDGETFDAFYAELRRCCVRCKPGRHTRPARCAGRRVTSRRTRW